MTIGLSQKAEDQFDEDAATNRLLFLKFLVESGFT